MIIVYYILTSQNPKTLAYLNNIHRLLVSTSIAILMHPFPGACRSILVFHQFLKFNICLQHLYFFLVSNRSFINDAVAALELSYLFLAKIKRKSQRKITIPSYHILQEMVVASFPFRCRNELQSESE